MNFKQKTAFGDFRNQNPPLYNVYSLDIIPKVTFSEQNPNNDRNNKLLWGILIVSGIVILGLSFKSQRQS